MKILRFTAKHAVTQYGSYSKGQIIEVSDEFAAHLIELNLAEEVQAAKSAQYNKAFAPSGNPEKKQELNTGEYRPIGRGITSQSLAEGQASQNQTSKRSPDKR